MDCKNKRNKKGKKERKKDGCIACCWDKWGVRGEGRGGDMEKGGGRGYGG